MKKFGEWQGRRSRANRREHPEISLFFVVLLLMGLHMGCVRHPVPPINKTPDNLAIKGYDSVAYFTEGRPVLGLPAYEITWNGATWRFASEEHREMFRQSPEQYAPRYGGYCAYAVSQGKTADIDPEAWSIVDNRLYLNLNKDVQGLWERNRQEYIRKADENWPHLSGEGT